MPDGLRRRRSRALRPPGKTVAVCRYGRLIDPDRWLPWMGVLFVLIVCFFPAGIVLRLRERR